MKRKVVDHLFPDIPFEITLKRMGYHPRKSKLDEEWKVKIRNEISAVGKYIKPAAVYNEVKILNITESSVLLQDGLVFESEQLSKKMKGSRLMTMMACTVGAEVTEKISALGKYGKMMESVIWDAAASEAVEAVADKLNQILIQQYRLRGFQPTIRFSPGYGGWKTDIQPRFLEYLNASEIGISSGKDSFILYPEKSITAVIGWKK